MKTDSRTAGWLKGRIILLSLAGLLLTPQAAAPADVSYDSYYRAILSDRYLGPGYAQEYYNLVKGNYRYGAKLGAYCVYAFSNGFRKGYELGCKRRQYVDKGLYPSNAQQLKAESDSNYNYLRSFVLGWKGVTGLAERKEIDLAFYAGWRSGGDRGYREKGSTIPQPTNYDFRLYWSPGKSASPVPSDADPYDELRHAR